MHNLDISINHFLLINRTDSMVRVMEFITNLFGGTLYFAIIILAVIITSYYLRGWKHSAFFLFAIFTNVVFVYLLKSLFNVSRPLEAAILETGKSFPSNHAATATVFFIMLIYLFKKYFEGLARWVFNFLCVLGIFLISFSRVYLGVHWFSDVVGGIIIGTLVSCLLIYIFENERIRSFVRL